LPADGSGLTIRDIFNSLQSNTDPIARQAVELSADYLACGLASLLAVLAPELVVIGGGIADAGGAAYVELVGRLLMKRAAEHCVANTRVVKAALGNRAGFIGAGLLGDHI
jgi:glucokinase